MAARQRRRGWRRRLHPPTGEGSRSHRHRHRESTQHRHGARLRRRPHRRLHRDDDRRSSERPRRRGGQSRRRFPRGHRGPARRHQARRGSGDATQTNDRPTRCHSSQRWSSAARQPTPNDARTCAAVPAMDKITQRAEHIRALPNADGRALWDSAHMPALSASRPLRTAPAPGRLLANASHSLEHPPSLTTRAKDVTAIDKQIVPTPMTFARHLNVATSNCILPV